MSDVMEADEFIEYGMSFNTRKVIPYWQHREIKSMGIIEESKLTYVWELTLDCGHTVIEPCSKSAERSSPTGQYRDCKECHDKFDKRKS